MMTASTRFSARRAKHAAGAPCCDPSARYCAVGRLPAALVVQMITDRVAFGRFVCAPCAAFYNLPLAIVPLPVSVETLTPADVAAAAASVILAVQQQQQQPPPRINFDALDSDDDDDDTQHDDAAVAPPADAVPAVNGSGNAIGSSTTTSWSGSEDNDDDDDDDEYTIIEPSNDGNDSSSSEDDGVPTMTVEELAALRSTIPCRFLLKRNGGVCPFGDTCRYKHAVPPSGTDTTTTTTTAAATKQQQQRSSSATQRRNGGRQQRAPLCRQYVRTGRCNRGTSCGYEHSEESNYV